MTRKKAKKGKLPATLTKRVRAMDRVRLLLLLAYIQVLLGARKMKGSSRKTQGKRTHHLKPGIHHVTIRGKSRKVRVLANGKWRFMKG